MWILFLRICVEMGERKGSYRKVNKNAFLVFFLSNQKYTCCNIISQRIFYDAVPAIFSDEVITYAVVLKSYVSQETNICWREMLR